MTTGPKHDKNTGSRIPEVAQMEPFYFSRDRSLFGMYHMPEGVPRKRGIIIAGPLLNEGIRAQFALRLIASRCAALGYDVLRFDYAGLGNSLGRPKDFSIARWEQDIITAAGELNDVSGVEAKAVICVRFAANLVASVSQSLQLDQLLLWDPVFTGTAWLAELREARQFMPKILLGSAELDEEYSGHIVNSAFVDELTAREISGFNADSIFAVTSRDFRQEEQLRRFVENTATAESDCRWRSGGSEILYPGDVIEALCSQLT